MELGKFLKRIKKVAKDNAVHKDLTAHTFKEVMIKMYTTVYHMGKR